VAEVFALHRGEFGRAALLKLRAGLAPHAHSDAHIVWWLGGAPVAAQVGDHCWHSTEHAAIAVNPYESHDLRILDSDRPAICLALYISRDWLRARARPQAFLSPFLRIDPTLHRASAGVMNLMLDERSAAHEREREIERLIQAALGASVHDDRSPRAWGSAFDGRIRRALAFMHANMSARLPVEEVARRVGLSRPHFFAMFRDQLNTPPHIYWNALRLEAAINRLMHGEVSLTAIALDLGFSASSNFSRFFRDHTGVTPREYRRAAQAALPGILRH
jgi:AraC-like DNA-binding protein